MSPVRPINLWVEALHPESSSVVLDVFEIDERFSFEYGESPDAWYAWRGGERVSLGRDDVRRLHVLNRGWLWRSDHPERFPEPPFLLTDDSDTAPAHDRPVTIRPSESIRSLIAGEVTEGSGRYIQLLMGQGWAGVLIVTRADADRGHLVAFSRSGTIPDPVAEELALPDLDEPFGAIELADGRTLGTEP
jgi:hypothetical protein